MRRIFLIGLIAAAVTVPSAASARLISALGITLQSCNANVNGNVTNGINVVYYSTHQSPATEVISLYDIADRNTCSSIAERSRSGPRSTIISTTRSSAHRGRAPMLSYAWRGA